MPILEDEDFEVEASVSENEKFLAVVAEFPIGSKATLKGYIKPLMVVQGVWQDTGEVLVGCLWFNAQDRLEEKEFISDVLQKAT